MTKQIYITRPYLPPLEDFLPYVEKIWNTRVLTNGGELHQKLEAELCQYLGVKYISLFNNGTNALLVALKALNLEGEVITTPFSFAATAHSILWNNLTPVFVDIEKETFNIDAKKIEAAITEKTTGILPVHCFGNPCAVDEIKKIADKHSLKVIYDAAHCFAVKNKNISLLNHGDLSVLSFHATKVFNTFEGGAIVSHSLEQKKNIDSLKNFGIVNEEVIDQCGMNGKMSEINAALGLAQLPYLDATIAERKKIDQFYQKNLKDVVGIELFNYAPEAEPNFSYFPILVNKKSKVSRDELYEKLKTIGIFSRRYFYPLLSNLAVYQNFPSATREKLPVGNEIASQVLCLPIYPSLELEVMEKIVSMIRRECK